MTHSRLRIPLVLGVTFAIAALTAAGAIGGNTRHFDSKVTLAQSNPFHGSVVSTKHACEVQRTVKVFNQRPGPDGFFDSTKTDRRGKWEIPSMPRGKFYAKLKRREEGTAGTIFICSGDQSPTRNY